MKTKCITYWNGYSGKISIPQSHKKTLDKDEKYKQQIICKQNVQTNNTTNMSVY